ncbi:MAG: hypothetical protein HQL29_00840 [Candidatus Omnitrophica bacterium]|nr:hypothetical protein [Candidatus Omnitrophota bacterium]
MAIVEKSILITAGVIFVGLVGYKIVKKKNPKLIDDAKVSLDKVKLKTDKIISSAKNAFREGYASA